MFYLSKHLQWFAGYRRKTAKKDDIWAFAALKGLIGGIFSMTKCHKL